MTLFIERYRAERALEELTQLLAPKVRADLEVIHVSIGYGIQITLKERPAPNFEWIAVYRGIPIIYDRDGCDLHC